MTSQPRSITLRPVAAAFVVFGMYGGAFAVAAVDIERTFGLSDAQLGFLLALGIVTATAVAAVGGAITDRWGAGPTLRRSLAAWGILLVAEAVAVRIGIFAVVFTLAVAIGGLLDVVMNVTAADALAQRPGKLVRFHGLWNGGCVLGAIVTGVVLRAGWSWRAAWVVIAIAAIATGAATRRSRVPEPPKVDHPSMLRALLGLRHEGLLVLGLVFGASAMVEGGIATWGILYLRGHLGLGVLAGVTAYVVGQFLATTARVGGSPVVSRLGTRRSVVLGAGLAAGGIALEALCDIAGVAAVGLVAAGMGISVVATPDRRREQRGAASCARHRRGDGVRLPRDGRGTADRGFALGPVRSTDRTARAGRSGPLRRSHPGARPHARAQRSRTCVS